MPLRNKEPPAQPQRLTGFFLSAQQRPQQNGSGARTSREKKQTMALPHGTAAHQPPLTQGAPGSGSSYPYHQEPGEVQTTGSPGGETWAQDMEASGLQNTQRPTTADIPDPIAGIPTSGQSVSDTVLKGMLMSLRSSLHNDLLSTVSKCHDHIEQAMREYSIAYNTLVDAHSAHSDEMLWIK